jgi:hypothetical membrane protein
MVSSLLIIVRNRMVPLLPVSSRSSLLVEAPPTRRRAEPDLDTDRDFFEIRLPDVDPGPRRTTQECPQPVEGDIAMTVPTSPPVPSPTAAPRAGRTGTLLAAGLVAGPVFVVTVTVQALTRDGFDLGRHPISLLGVGAAGWVQIANFVLAGLLSMAFAVGVRRVLGTGPGATWAPRLLAVFGAGLVAGGVFVADPALGFPPGTPPGMPDEMSWHGVLHAAAPPVAFLALVAACLVLARWYRRAGHSGLAVYSAATALVCLALSAWPSQDGASVRLFAAVVIGFAWLSVLALRLARETRRPG